ncbi:polyketide synthase dehydratase domain-containing protein, partial [Streptomyces sp. NPDC019531]|uniref:polyketide synthase dehydratase domain-containing protein n=1 Tax=Streptomyces sp. NPDC019531 TaxID=3365062 RepID=UPI00384BE8AB
DAVTALDTLGVTRFVEIGPQGVLTALTQQNLPDDTRAVTAVPSLRAGQDEPHTLLTALARLYVTGVPVDWQAFYTEDDAHPSRIDLPTYAFQRRRYWVQARLGGGDVTAAGLDSADHPLLGAAISLADSGGLVLTGRLSAGAASWLADHVVGGSVLFPGTGFVELAIHAGDQVGCGALEELTLQAPLVLTAREAVQIQVVVGAGEESGVRGVSVYSRADGADGAGDPDLAWTLHATGTLTAQAGRVTAAELTQWPPIGADALDLDGLYARFADAGMAYGAAFQGLERVWKQGDTVFAEVALPEQLHGDAESFGIHPALLDACLHAAFADSEDGGRLPFAWSGVTLHAVGATAARVRLTPSGSGGTTVAVADAEGRPVATIDSIAFRPLPAASASAPQQPLYRMEWTPADSVPSESSAYEPVASMDWDTALGNQTAVEAQVLVLRCERQADCGPDGTRATLNRVLTAVQQWLADERFSDTKLMVVTNGAVAVGDSADIDPAGAAVWGFVRAAQWESPERLILVDTDGPLDVAAVLAEPQAVVRDGRVYVGRLVKVPGVSAELLPSLPSLEGTVLVTGGTGGLGGVVAR